MTEIKVKVPDYYNRPQIEMIIGQIENIQGVSEVEVD